MQLPASRRAVTAFRAALALGLVALLGVLTIGVHRAHVVTELLVIDCTAIVAFGLALLGLAGSRLPVRTGLVGVVLVGAALQIGAMTTGPVSSDDVYRYGWDAKVQLAGIDPYRYSPADQSLDRLRSQTLFPRAGPCSWTLPGGRCSRVNRPSVHTIYPPVAEAAFTVGRVFSLGRTDGARPMQVMGGLGTVALSILLAQQALRRRRPAWTVAVWAWCPATVLEVANNAHVDWLAALLSVAALVAVLDRRPRWAGVLIGAAIATKLYPGVLLASMLRRRPLAVLVTALGFVALTYLPHVFAVGGRVIGYLPGYLREENYVNGGRFVLLDRVLPEPLLAPAAVVVLLGVGCWALRCTDPDRPQDTAVVVMGCVLLVTTPSYPWYALVMIALVAMSARLEWLPLALAMSLAAAAIPHAGTHGVAVDAAIFSIGGLVPLGRAVVGLRRSRQRAPSALGA